MGSDGECGERDHPRARGILRRRGGVVKERAEREQRGAGSGGPRGAGEWGSAATEGTVSGGLRDGGWRGWGRAGRRRGGGAGQAGEEGLPGEGGLDDGDDA